MVFNYYLPPKTYAFLVKIAEEYRLSVKEVQRIFINKVAARLGFKCPHERVGYAKADPEHKPFCKDCWSRLKAEKPEPYRIGTQLIKSGIRYVERETFLDKLLEETRAEAEAKRKKKRQMQGERKQEEEQEDASELVV
jgi:hypothetical protein